ncbi:MAG: hypothetical protein JXR18_13470 [Neptuniibacter sp.]
MGKAALKEITSSNFMLHVWQDMLAQTPRSKRDGFGHDKISVNQFSANCNHYIESLSQEIRGDNYIPNPLTPHFIPKPDGKKERVICVPSVSDRLIQRCVLNYLNNKGYTLNNEISFGFVKGKANGVKKAITKALTYRKEYPWVYKADISAFFDKIDRSILKDLVIKKIRYPSLHNLIFLSIDTEIYCPQIITKKKIKQKGIVEGQGLRQGMPISPYLANLYLCDFDKLAIKSNLRMVRYADDLIVFCSSEAECRKVHDFCSDSLAKLGLDIHDIADNTKTQIVAPDEMVEFLGFGLQKKFRQKGFELVVTDNQKSAMKRKLMEYADVNYCQKRNITISKLLSQLNSKIAGYESAYDICSNNQQLSDSLKDYKSEVLSNLFSKNFQIDIGALEKRQRSFLELE